MADTVKVGIVGATDAVSSKEIALCLLEAIRMVATDKVQVDVVQNPFGPEPFYITNHREDFIECSAKADYIGDHKNSLPYYRQKQRY